MTWTPTRIKPGTVGPAIPGCEVTLAEDGEIICRGGNVFLGYLDDPEKTAEALDDDGWLHTGDIGELDDDGYLRIVDRKKELIITAGGKNISPANLEAALKMIPLVGQACAIGDQRPFVAALVVLDPEVAPAWAAAARASTASSLAELAEHPDVVAEVERGPRRGHGAVQQRRAGQEGHGPRRGVAARLRGAHADLEAQAARHPRPLRRARSRRSTPDRSRPGTPAPSPTLHAPMEHDVRCCGVRASSSSRRRPRCGDDGGATTRTRSATTSRPSPTTSPTATSRATTASRTLVDRVNELLELGGDEQEDAVTEVGEALADADPDDAADTAEVIQDELGDIAEDECDIDEFAAFEPADDGEDDDHHHRARGHHHHAGRRDHRPAARR